MAKYIGPKSKIARKFGEPIFGPDKAFEHKNYPPGMHGNSKRRKKVSEYGVQLKEKQKVKYMYGILERQFRNIFDKAHSHKGITGTVSVAVTWKPVWIMSVFPSGYCTESCCSKATCITQAYNCKWRRS